MRGNRNSYSNGIPMGMGGVFGLLMGMGIVLMGMEMACFIGKNRISTGSVNTLLFLHSNSLINVEQ